MAVLLRRLEHLVHVGEVELQLELRQHRLPRRRPNHCVSACRGRVARSRARRRGRQAVSKHQRAAPLGPWGGARLVTKLVSLG